MNTIEIIPMKFKKTTKDWQGLTLSIFMFFISLLFSLELSQLLQPDEFKTPGPFSILVFSYEILIVILLVLPSTRVVGIYAIFCSLVLFTLYIIGILNFSTPLRRSFPIIIQLNWSQYLLANNILMLIALSGIWFQTKFFSSNR